MDPLYAFFPFILSIILPPLLRASVDNVVGVSFDKGVIRWHQTTTTHGDEDYQFKTVEDGDSPRNLLRLVVTILIPFVTCVG